MVLQVLCSSPELWLGPNRRSLSVSADELWCDSAQCEHFLERFCSFMVQSPLLRFVSLLLSFFLFASLYFETLFPPVPPEGLQLFPGLLTQMGISEVQNLSQQVKPSTQN